MKPSPSGQPPVETKLPEPRAPMLVDFIHHNPGEKPLTSRFLDSNHLHDLGFTGRVANSHVQACVTLRDFAPDLWEGNEDGLRWIESYADEVRPRIQETKEAGLHCFAWTDFVVFPKVLVERHEKEIVSQVRVCDEIGVKGVFTPDIEQPLTQAFLRAQIREIFEVFPELDGLVVRVGETYLHDLPHHTGGDPIVNGVESHVLLIGLLRQEICVRLNRSLIYRTWMSGIDEDAEQYLVATARIEPPPKLFFSIKHCVGDYHRTHRVSPPLGLGKHQQLVEVQCQREYEGKGAFPNFIAGGVIDGFEEDARLMPAGRRRCLRDLLDSDTYAGLFTWSRGGGWMGPYIGDELWCAINTQVLALWARSPEAPTDQLVGEALTSLGFTASHLPSMKRILELSSQAVLRGVTGSRGDIHTEWTRDEFLGGFEPECPPMTHAVNTLIETNRVDQAIEEQREALVIWREIEALAETVDHSDSTRLRFLKTSCRYGRIFQEVVCAGWEVILLGERGIRDGKREAEGILRAAREYERAWSEWRDLSRRPECPTLYQDRYCRYVTDKGMEPVPGMGRSIVRYVKLAETVARTQASG